MAARTLMHSIQDIALTLSVCAFLNRTSLIAGRRECLMRTISTGWQFEIHVFKYIHTLVFKK